MHAAREKGPNACAAPDHQIADIAVVDLAQLLRARAGAPQFHRMPERREPSGQQRAGAAHVTTQQRTNRLAEQEDERDRQDPHECQHRVRLAQHAHSTARLVFDFLGRALTRLARFGDRRALVPYARRRCNDDARTRKSCTPTQVDVVSARERRRIEAGERVEEIGTHEHHRVRHVEHVADTVVLFLVDFLGLDARERHAVVVDGHADLEQDFGVLAVDEFGADDAGVRAVRLFDEEPDRVGIGGHVVVAEEQEGRTFDRSERVVGRGRESEAPARRLGAPPNECTGHGGRDPRRRIVGRTVVDDEDGQGRIVLGRERVERLFQPGSGIVGDDHGDHRRNDLDRLGPVVAYQEISADRGGIDGLHEAGRG